MILALTFLSNTQSLIFRCCEVILVFRVWNLFDIIDYFHLFLSNTQSLIFRCWEEILVVCIWVLVVFVNDFSINFFLSNIIDNFDLFLSKTQSMVVFITSWLLWMTKLCSLISFFFHFQLVIGSVDQSVFDNFVQPNF